MAASGQQITRCEQYHEGIPILAVVLSDQAQSSSSQLVPCCHSGCRNFWGIFILKWAYVVGTCTLSIVERFILKQPLSFTDETGVRWCEEPSEIYMSGDVYLVAEGSTKQGEGDRVERPFWSEWRYQ